MRILLAFIVKLTLVASLSAQNSTYSIDIDSVEVSEKVKEKTFQLGLHRVFSIGTKTLSLTNMREVAFHIKPKEKKPYLINKAFIKLILYEEVDKTVPIVIRLRKVNRQKQPARIIFEDTLNLWDYIHKKRLTVDLKDQNIRFKKRGVFLSIEAVNKDDKLIGVEMTSREAEARTYFSSVFKSDKEWQKHTFSTGKKPWNAKAGLELIRYK